MPINPQSKLRVRFVFEISVIFFELGFTLIPELSRIFEEPIPMPSFVSYKSLPSRLPFINSCLNH